MNTGHRPQPARTSTGQNIFWPVAAILSALLLSAPLSAETLTIKTYVPVPEAVYDKLLVQDIAVNSSIEGDITVAGGVSAPTVDVEDSLTAGSARFTGSVSIAGAMSGTTATVSAADLNVTGVISASGGIRIGNITADCDSTIEGMLRYTGTGMEYCGGDPLGWQPM